MRQLILFKSYLVVITATLCNVTHCLEIAGTDLLSDALRQAIVDELATAGIPAVLDMDGSLLGKRDLEEGAADAAIFAVPDGSGESLPGKVYPFGFQLVTFAVNADNPLTELDYGQLGEIFRSDGGIANWSDLVAGNEWKDKKLSLWAARTPKAISLEIFNSVVLDGSPLKQSIRYTEPDRTELGKITGSNDAVLMVLPYLDPGNDIRILAIKPDTSSQSYTPSADNVFYGDYPLRLPFQLVIADRLPAESAGALVRAIYSDRVTRAMEDGFFLPVPLPERRAVLNQLK